MPEWLHNRAEHIKAKNPSMDESTAFAIATQQSHALGKSPKGYGTAKGRAEAKKKYNTPGDDKKTADPGNLGKEAGLFNLFKRTAVTPMIEDQTRQIVREELARQNQPQKPRVKHKTAGIPSVLDLVDGFSDELRKIATIKTAILSQTAGMPATPGSVKNMTKLPSTSTPINAAPRSPVQSHQPVAGPPPVRG